MGRLRIKLKPAPWSSGDYAIVRYSTNGIFWHTIQSLQYDRIDRRYYITAWTIIMQNNMDHALKKFSTIQEIREHHKDLKKTGNIRNSKQIKEEKAEQTRINNLYKKHSK